MRIASDDISMVVRSHEKSVLTFLLFLGCAVEEAEDMTQEAFLVWYARRDSVPGDSVRAFLFSTAKRLAIDAMKSSRRRDDILRGQAALVMWERHVGDTGIDDHLERLRECLEKLPPRSRLAVDMRYGAEAPSRRIAEELGLTVANVDTVLSRARAGLKRCIEGSGTP